MAKKLKPIPSFRDEEQEQKFWATHDFSDYFDLAKSRRVAFPNLEPSTSSISLRLPAGLLADLKVLANRMDVPYQSLLKVYLAERVERELRGDRSPAELAGLVREPEPPYGTAPRGTHRRLARPPRRRRSG
jgi:predicted DNA binding CopG/RHH family protein